MFGVAQVHFEMVPCVALEDAHFPWAGDGVGKLPDNVEALLVGKALVVGLDDRVAALPEVRTQCV